MITLTDALRQMETGKAFQISFVTCNISKGTGGEIIKLNDCFKVGAKYNMKNNDIITVRRENSSDHPYPIHIHLITEFNKQQVVI